MRKAIVRGAGTPPDLRRVEVFLPSNYKIMGATTEHVIIGGEDVAGWSLDDYVIPRLASGLLFAKEIDE